MIDTSFDFRCDANGKDPDSASPTLKRYHKLLWSKPLPSGEKFVLVDAGAGRYLKHESSIGTFFLSSDSVLQTFTRWKSMAPIIGQMSQAENEEFQRITYSIGGMILFPGNRVDRKMTINGARGMNEAIADRFDLTLECIRRHFRDESSPLGSVLERYADFFALFGDFRGYVSFFLLEDIVTPSGEVRFFIPFDNFNSPPRPTDLATYLKFREQTIQFNQARNRRITLWSTQAEC